MPVKNLHALQAQFKRDEKRFGIERVQRIQAVLTRTAFERIVERTPEDTGETKKSWTIVVSASNSPGLLASIANFAGTATRGKRGVQVSDPAINFNQANQFLTLTIVNLQPHIGILEFGGFVPKNPGPNAQGILKVKDGYSVQAPKGMVGLTFEEIRVMRVP